MYFIGGIMETETVEEFKKKRKKSLDDLINFKPTKKVAGNYQQRRMTSQEAKGKSGWRRGLALGGSIK